MAGAIGEQLPMPDIESSFEDRLGLLLLIPA
jgi:hypothetical protein